MASNSTVGQAWRDGRPAASEHMLTDGKNLYSYAHLIGTTDAEGRKIIQDCHYSQTTLSHVRQAVGAGVGVTVVFDSCHPGKGRQRRAQG